MTDNFSDLVLASHNNFSKIPTEWSSKLFSIRFLDLSDNHIDWLQRGQFRTSDKLQKLLLARNKITEIGTGAFGSCQNLKLLDLKVFFV